MTKKLAISPDVSYMLGIYCCNNSYDSICLSTASNELVARFVKIAVLELGTKPEFMSIDKEEDFTNVTINNSKLKKLLENALKGIFIKHMKSYDAILLERIGFHTTGSSGKIYIKKALDFIMFIAPYSIKAKVIRQPGKE
jgi:hypothetical protein